MEDLKGKYVMVKGDAEYIDQARKTMFSMSSNKYGFEGICLSENLDKLAGCNISVEMPTLSQISVAIMRNHSRMVNQPGRR